MPTPTTVTGNHTPRSSRIFLLVTAVLGALVGLGTMPFLAVSGFLAGGWNGAGGPPLLDALYTAWPDAFRWAAAGTVQQAYGRPLLFVFAALLAGMTVWQPELLGAPRAARRARRAIVTGLLLSAAGNITDYWLGPDFHLILWRVGFALFTMPGLLLILCGSTVLGALMLRSGASASGVALSLVLPAAVLNTAGGLHYLPAGPIFPFCLAWLVVFGAACRRTETRA